MNRGGWTSKVLIGAAGHPNAMNMCSYCFVAAKTLMWRLPIPITLMKVAGVKTSQHKTKVDDVKTFQHKTSMSVVGKVREQPKASSLLVCLSRKGREYNFF
ncbi:Hypothetical predicted protein [Prunus dulcis]|uniref:Uncharacterized protein n=1 Tax=Prunus dulcis TaxID=3755 RepID=A0A5E4G562_PRUDU|nr:hypothetical protein L3X38_034543 [Prunus dulcis]VVA34750.1 Hypothetical predicted protein [Prunus dulcis]